MKIAVHSLLFLFLAARRVLGEDNPPYTDDGGGYGYGYGVLLAGKNDCLVAETITSVPFTSSGDTRDTLGQGFDEAQTCSLVEEYTRGVWFQLSGDGLCYNATSLGSTFDTTIMVYTGEADCEDLFCLTENDDGSSSGYGYGYGGGFNTTGGGFDATSKAEWRTKIGEMYYVLLGGLAGQAGLYEFSLNFTDCDALPSAEDCVNAAVIDTSAPFFDSGNTTFTDVQAFPEASTCSLVGPSTQGVWYTLEGDGACYNATTLGSRFDTILSVYIGEAGCQELFCLIENDDGSSNGYGYGYGGGFGVTSKVVWRTEVGQTYYILLGGLSSTSGPYRFSLEATDCSVLPSNDECTNATVISNLPYFDTNTTANRLAGFDEAQSCSFVNDDTRGVWYTLVGDGLCYNASTSGTRNLDTTLSVFTGESGCQDLTCFAENDDGGSDLTSLVLWETEPGVSYYILVAAISTQAGPYQLSVDGGECPPRPSNDRCTNATAIGSFPFSTSTSIVGARNVPFGSSASSCYNVDPSTRGVWYQLDGDGSCVKVALQSNFAAGIAVYKGGGSCQDLTCAFQSPYLQVGASNYTLSTETGQTYYILVGGHDDDIGFFSLDVSKGTCAPNDQCNNATKIAEIPFKLSGTNAFSTPEALDSGVSRCNNINPEVLSVWYEVQGDGSCLTASLPFADFSSNIAVLGGSGCGNLTCLGEGQYYDTNQVTWQTEVGEAYFLLVGGFGATGNFDLEIERGDCPENDRCQDAAHVDFPFVESASNALATGEGYDSAALSCSVIYGSSKTLWYEVVGDGSCLSASVAGESFEVVLGLYEGACGELSCLDQTGYDLGSRRDLLSWRSVIGTTYRIVVGGAYGPYSGDFILAITAADDCPEPPENDECETAFNVTAFPFTATGSTLLASPLNIGGYGGGYYGNRTYSNGTDSGCSFLDPSSKSVWYLVEGDGLCMTASVDSRNFDPSVSVLRGTECDEFVCVSGSENYYAGAASWQSEVDEMYYVIVGGRYGSVGAFSLTIESGECLDNDQCENATPISLPFLESASSSLATAEGYDSAATSCYIIDGSARTVWYEFLGSGSCVSAAVTGEFDASLALYSLEENDCDLLTCVAQSEYVGSRNLLSLRTVSGTTYKVAIAGAYGASAGDYQLVIADSDDCPEIPANDRCEGAFYVSAFPFTDTGSTEGATADDHVGGYVGSGGPSSAPSSIFPPFPSSRRPSSAPSSIFPPFPSECYNVEPSTKSVWYIMRGDGSCLSASTLGSNFDTVLAIYKGDGCEDLTCVTQSEYDYNDEVSWKTEIGEIYYILVGGSYGNAGSYFLQIEQGNCPDNDRCETATTIDNFPFIVAPNNDFHSSEGYGSPATSCNYVDGSAKTVWYELEGDGSCLSASVVGEGFRPLLALYDGDDCDLIACKAQTSSGNGYGFDGSRGLLSWRTQNGASYKLVVAGERYQSNSGDYVLAVTVADDCPEAPENDECETAFNVTSFPFTDTGSTRLASPLVGENSNVYGYGYKGDDDDAPGPYDDDAGPGGPGGYYIPPFPENNCRSFDPNSKSVWYMVEGDGSCMTASVTSRNFDASVSIFTGNQCELTCINRSDDYSPDGASWQTVTGELFYLAIGGTYGSSGDFFLEIKRGPCPDNDNCVSATAVEALPFVDFGSTLLATEEGFDSAATSCSVVDGSAKTLWYELIGDGSCVSASVVGEDFEAILALYDSGEGGVCDSIICMAQTGNYNNNGGLLSWWGESGTVYKILVTGVYRSGGGDFLLAIANSEDCPEVPQNDECENAFNVSTFPFSITGNNELATDNPDRGYGGYGNTCYDIYGVTNTVWYKVVGDGSCFTASVSSDFEVLVAVFRGECEGLRCLGQAEYYREPGLSWDTVSGLSYYVLVSGYGSSGTFVLDIERDNCVENDRCSNATAVDRLPIVISASTSLASVAGYNSPATVCNTVNGDAKAVWYELIGDGSCVSASIVGEGFDAILSLYEGDNCGSLTCLAQSNIGNGSSGRGLLSWRTENGSTYKILVAGAYGLQAGDYVLGITNTDECPEAPENDECETAFNVTAFPFSDSGSLDFASVAGSSIGYGYGNNCYNVRPTTKSVWYLVEGDGSCYTASAAGSAFETVVAIYDGQGCDRLSCSAQSEYGNEISWETRNGETYYILVGGLYESSGVFSLSIERGECPSNFRCSRATPIDAGSLPYFESASNSLAAPAGYGSPATRCNIVDGSAKTLWYEIIGDGSCLSASIAGEDFEAGLALYQGDFCESINCLAQTDYDNRGRLSWRSINGTTYRMVVTGAFSAQAGNFLLAVASAVDGCPEPPENDKCESAFNVDAFPFSDSGSTEDATPPIFTGGGYGGYYGNNNCQYVDSSAKSVWFTLVGDGGCYTTSTYGSRSEIIATVLRGTQCGSLVCLGQSDFYNQNGFTWETEIGETYYILVGGIYGNAGSFALDIDRGECLENDLCDNAAQVDSIPFVDAASNSLATQEGPGRPGINCYVAEHISNTVWYELDGDGSCWSASVVGEGFETGLVLFEGDACDRILCANENYFGNPNVVKWQTEIGSTYKLMVGGLYRDQAGDYILAITSVDDCSQSDTYSRSPSPSYISSPFPSQNGFTGPPIFDAAPTQVPSQSDFTSPPIFDATPYPSRSPSPSYISSPFPSQSGPTQVPSQSGFTSPPIFDAALTQDPSESGFTSPPIFDVAPTAVPVPSPAPSSFKATTPRPTAGDEVLVRRPRNKRLPPSY